MRRFYKGARSAPVAGGFGVFLDDRPVMTPGKRILTVPRAALGDAVADEWSAQEETVDPMSMPLTRFANTALDIVGGKRGEVVAEIAGYGETDLVCYRVDRPAELRRRQEAAWDPLVDWIGEECGVRLEVTAGLIPAPQPEEAVAALRARVAALDDFVLAAFQRATGALGSVVLALAMTNGRLGAEEAWAASTIDEAYQAERWGEDGEAGEVREVLRSELLAADRFIRLCRS
ncbi:MAG: ATPase [Defluviicoccus sp.]|nr:ATPase [Defluviicoccus sp.]MDE0277775.1 ATPase [Defluviicoccus sp.]